MGRIISKPDSFTMIWIFVFKPFSKDFDPERKRLTIQARPIWNPSQAPGVEGATRRWPLTPLTSVGHVLFPGALSGNRWQIMRGPLPVHPEEA